MICDDVDKITIDNVQEYTMNIFEQDKAVCNFSPIMDKLKAKYNIKDKVEVPVEQKK